MIEESRQQVMTFDHPIFTESIRLIKAELGPTGLDPLQQQVLERLIHSSGDFGLKDILKFSTGACQQGISSLIAGAPILTDTAMAAAAVSPMASRTLKSQVRCVLEWAPAQAPQGATRTAIGMNCAWEELSKEFQQTRSPIVLIGSAPKALETLLDLISNGAFRPSLIIGMPVGFVGVAESKRRLSESDIAQIRLDGTRGGAALAAACINALLRAAKFSQ